MSKRIGYMFQNSQLTLVLDGQPFDVPSTHPEYKKITPLISSPVGETDEMEGIRLSTIMELITSEAKKIQKLEKAIRDSIGFDDVKVEHGTVLIKGKAVHSTLTKRILELHAANLPFAPFVNFLVNLEKNPSEESRATLFDFLERGRFPLTDDGCFLGYKGVVEGELKGKQTLVDARTRSYDMTPGNVHTMPWEAVDNNSNEACGAGFHTGTIGHAKNFGSKMILVKVNPKDCVSVPKYDTTKLRSCSYEVVNVYTEHRGAQELALPAYTPEQYKAQDFEQFEIVAREEMERLQKEEEEEEAVSEREVFTSQSRDDLCREAANRGIFFSTNEARELGKDLVIEALLLNSLPFEHMSRDQVVALAVRRRLFPSENAAKKAGRDEVERKLTDSVSITKRR